MENVRLFLFHTTFGSGADASFPPLTSEELRGPEPWAPVFATRRGLAVKVADPGGGVLDIGRDLSVIFAVEMGAAAFEARNVLLTLTALKVAGFLGAEEFRPCPLSLASFCCSACEGSVSEPPLVTSGELTGGSSMRLFSPSSWLVPFTVEWST